MENFAALADEYRNLVFSLCLRLTGDYFAAEDLTQETFLAAFRSWDRFDGRSAKAWLCRIAANKCTDYLRAAPRRDVPTEEETLSDRAAPSGDEPLQSLFIREAEAELRRCCASLPPTLRDTAERYYLSGQTAAEISTATGLPLKTVQSRLLRARVRLKKLYRKELLEP